MFVVEMKVLAIVIETKRVVIEMKLLIIGMKMKAVVMKMLVTETRMFWLLKRHNYGWQIKMLVTEKTFVGRWIKNVYH
jgi:hypothetical protein